MLSIDECRKLVTWWSDGADYSSQACADISKSVRKIAVEIIAIPGPQNPCALPYRQFNLSFKNKTCLLCRMGKDRTRIRPGLILLDKHLHLSARKMQTNDAVRDFVRISNFYKVFTAVDRAVVMGLAQAREEFGHGRAQGFYNRAQRVDRRAHLVAFDQRNGRMGNPGPRRKLA